MTELWSYSLSDLLLFSPRVYVRLFELRNQALWPAHILTIALGLLTMWLVACPTSGRHKLAVAICGTMWVWLSWSFFWTDYATINWAAAYFAPLAALQGVLLVTVAGLGKYYDTDYPDKPRLLALMLLAVAVVIYPCVAPLQGRSWIAAEVIGIAPDPTAVATIAVLSCQPIASRLVLLIVPVLWSTISSLTLWTLGFSDFLIAPLCLLFATVAIRASSRR